MQEVFDKSFQSEKLPIDKPSVICFSAPWSEPGQQSLSTLKGLEDIYKSHLHFFCMNVDENANVPAELGVKTLPTIIIWHKGAIKETLAGQHEKRKIRIFIESFASS
ncbi:MAG: thioredoxin family protein [Pseudobacteriovorax sp.]|nr:thioredoxin family protein [Pseudobacteriovorax sp.]